MIYSWALAKTSESTPDKRRILAFVAGGLLPDIPTYLFFVLHTFILGSSQQQMWNVLYFDSGWSPFITLSHSLLLWPLLLLIASVFKYKILQYVSITALLHITMDFLVHHDDAYRHFWPLSNWKFLSPISYWDPAYYGYWVSLSDTILIILLLTWISFYYKTKKAQWSIGLLLGLYVLSALIPFG